MHNLTEEDDIRSTKSISMASALCHYSGGRYTYPKQNASIMQHTLPTGVILLGREPIELTQRSQLNVVIISDSLSATGEHFARKLLPTTLRYYQQAQIEGHTLSNNWLVNYAAFDACIALTQESLINDTRPLSAGYVLRNAHLILLFCRNTETRHDFEMMVAKCEELLTTSCAFISAYTTNYEPCYLLPLPADTQSRQNTTNNVQQYPKGAAMSKMFSLCEMIDKQFNMAWAANQSDTPPIPWLNF